MKNSILEKLEKSIEFSNNNKWSHWRKYLNSNSNYLNPNRSLGFGTYSKKSLFKTIFHYVFCLLIFDNSILKSETYKKYKIFLKKSKRQINQDIMRHVFTFDLLKKINSPSNVCVIGDGGMNMNIQELGTLVNYNIKLKTIIPNNHIYGIAKAYQKTNFNV